VAQRILAAVVTGYVLAIGVWYSEPDRHFMIFPKQRSVEIRNLLNGAFDLVQLAFLLYEGGA